jgi:HAMP domain-containing protein
MMRRPVPLNVLLLAVITPVIVLSTAGFGYAAYVRLYTTILEGFDRKLAALSSATSVFIDVDETLALLAQAEAMRARGEDPEQHPTYQKYVLPMRQIRERAGLTFLYTQLLESGEGRQCRYLLDGTVGEGHSDFGAVDTIPEEDWDVALRVAHDGQVAQTAIRQWEQWGLLKCGWAPLYGADGEIKAMAGADVEITVIRKKTYVALLQTLGAGALSLMLASVVSVRVARRLTQPLGQVREAALQIASGDYRVRCQVDTPREIRALARTLNTLAQMMEVSVEKARPRMQAWRRQRAERTLIDRLAIPPYDADALAIRVLPGPHASGFVVDGPIAFIWHGRPERDQLAAHTTACDIATVARRVLTVQGVRGAAGLPGLLGERILSAAVVDLQSWTVQTHGRGLALSAPSGADADAAAVPIARGQTVLIAPPPVLSHGDFGPVADARTTADRVVSAVSATTGGVVAAIHRPTSHRHEGAA